MINEYREKRVNPARIVALILCVPTVVVMFLEWINVTFLNNITSKFQILNFIESKFTILDIVDLMEKFGGLFDDRLKNIIIIINVIRIVAVLGVVILFLCLFFSGPKYIKICSIFSLLMTSAMFGLFIYSINMINAKALEKSEKFKDLVEPTYWPYVMIGLSLLTAIVVFAGARSENKSVYTKKIR